MHNKSFLFTTSRIKTTVYQFNFRYELVNFKWHIVFSSNRISIISLLFDSYLHFNITMFVHTIYILFIDQFIHLTQVKARDLCILIYQLSYHKRGKLKSSHQPSIIHPFVNLFYRKVRSKPFTIHPSIFFESQYMFLVYLLELYVCKIDVKTIIQNELVLT